MLVLRSNTSLYFYRTFREGGRVVRRYVGSGPAAVAAAREFEAQRARRRDALEARRQAVRATVASLRELGREVSGLSARIDGSFHDAMAARGYYRHHRQWRRRGSNM